MTGRSPCPLGTGSRPVRSLWGPRSCVGIRRIRVRIPPGPEQSLQRLRDIGVRIGLDDFGTGFSSLAYLKRFPISFLKVDRTFVDGLGTDENDSAIVRATIALAHGLNLSVVAEGVETEDQLDRLTDLECDQVQGYLFSKPVPPEEFRPLLGMRWTS